MDPYLYALISTYVPEHFSTLTELAGGLLIKEIRDGNTYANGVLHSFNDEPAKSTTYYKSWWQYGRRDNDLPAMVWDDESQMWLQHGEIHRDNDLPAIISHSGTKKWYRYGNLHRDNDLPSIIYSDGSQEWHQNDQLHRDNDLPALICPSGTKKWFRRGLLHRDKGPAVVMSSGFKQWWKNGYKQIE